MISKTYNLGKIKQLIDVNGLTKNFSCEFSIEKISNEPAVVKFATVTQTDLDDGNINYNILENDFVSGMISSSNNVYQNHFIVIESDAPAEVKVNINTEEFEIQNSFNEDERGDETENFTTDNAVSSSINWTKIGLIVIVVIIGVGLIWYFYKKNKNLSSVDNGGFSVNSSESLMERPMSPPINPPMERPMSPPMERPMSPPMERPMSPPINPPMGNPKQFSLLERLNKLPI